MPLYLHFTNRWTPFSVLWFIYDVYKLFYGDENVSQNFLAIKADFFFWYNKKETETGIGHKLHPKRYAAKQSISILITPVYFAGFTFADH